MSGGRVGMAVIVPPKKIRGRDRKGDNAKGCGPGPDSLLRALFLSAVRWRTRRGCSRSSPSGAAGRRRAEARLPLASPRKEVLAMRIKGQADIEVFISDNGYICLRQRTEDTG